MPACLGLVAALGRLLPGPRMLAVRWRRRWPWSSTGPPGRGRPLAGALVQALGARSLREAGLLPQVEAPSEGSFWSGIDASYRLPVLIAYLALVVVTSICPLRRTWAS